MPLTCCRLCLLPMLSPIRNLLLNALNAPRALTTGVGVVVVSTLWSGAIAQAQTTLPSESGLNFQTSAPRRCANIGDWYTTAGIGNNNNGNCGTQFGGGPDPLNPPGAHNFTVSITQTDLDNAGGSVTITINDAESNGNLDETFNAPDPTRFALLLDGVEIAAQIFDGDPDGTNFSFPPITTPGLYTVTSQTGALPIFGDDTFGLNNDDNSFQISIPIDNLLIGQTQGSFQQDSGSPIEVDLFFLVGPAAEQLFLRNFDLDANGVVIDVSYEDPQGGVSFGTSSANQAWNGFDPIFGGPDLNFGGDVVNITSFGQTGRWTLTLDNYTSNNQTILEANFRDPVTGALTPIPLLDQPPLVAGNFTITTDTTLSTTVGTEVCHPFTVTNNFFTSDIINLTLDGTEADFAVELRDAAGTAALTDTDGDGVVDTGILLPGESRDFTLCVTPQEGAPSQDVTVVSGTSLLDTTIRQQAVEDGLPGADPDPDVQSVVKTTLIPAIGLAKAISLPVAVAGQPGVFDFDITYTVTNAGGTELDNVQITDDLQAVLIDNPTVTDDQGNPVPGNGADSFTVQSVTVSTTAADFSGTLPTANDDFNGDTDQNLFADTPNTFAVEDVAVVTLSVRVDLGSDGILDTENSAQTTGDDPNGDQVTDISQNGEEADTDDDGDPTDDNLPSPIQIPTVAAPEIGLAKAVSTPTAVPGQPGFFSFTLTYVVTNTGNEALNNVQVTDNLQAVLIDSPTAEGAPGDPADSFSVVGITTEFTGDSTAPPAANINYDGNADQNLFATTPNTFEVGDTATISVTVQVDLGSDGVLDTENSAETTGTSPSGGTVSDISQNGSDVDPGGGPTNNDDPTPISVSLDPSLVVVKRITNIFRQGTPLAIAGLGSFQDDPSDVDTALRDAFAAAGIANQPAGLLGLPEGLELQPNDEVEYTLYFWNNGLVDLNPVQLCDELQPPSVLNGDAFALQAVGPFTGGPAFTSPVGFLIQGRNPLDPIDGSADPLESGCISNPGTFPSGPPGPFEAGGGVVAGPFVVPANQYGAVRFRVVLP